MIGQIAWTLWYVALIAFVLWTALKITDYAFRLDDDGKEEK